MTATRIGAALLAGALVLGGGTAAAGTAATAAGTATTGSASWSAVLVDAGGTASTGHALTLTWPIGLVPQYVSVRNTGTLALTAQSYTVTGGTGAACVGGSWNILGLCTGAEVALTANAKVTLPVGGSAPIKVTPASTSVTLTVSTARANARAAATTSS